MFKQPNQNASHKHRKASAYGNTILLAQKNVCDILGVTDDKVDFEVVQLPQKKKFGIFGGKPAKVVATLKDPISDYATDFVKNVATSLTDKSLNVEVTDADANETCLNLSGDGVPVLIEDGGELIESIRLLTGIVVSNKKGEYHKIKVHAEGLEDKRRTMLEKIVEDAVQKVKETKEKVNLIPMNSYERLIVHQIVQSMKGIKSYSEGEKRDRHVVIELSNE